MPVQINEVVIKAHISEPGEKGGHPGGGGIKGSSAKAGPSPEKEEIIRECIEAVMELLNRKNER